MIKILDMSKVSPAEIFARGEDARDVSGIVSSIIGEVRQSGDSALLRYARELDHAELTKIEVPPEALDAAVAALSSDFRAIVEEAAENIRDFHRRQIRQSFVV